ncbi:MAG: hypothetical protein ACK56I_14115, partial [bacterium]
MEGEPRGHRTHEVQARYEAHAVGVGQQARGGGARGAEGGPGRAVGAPLPVALGVVHAHHRHAVLGGIAVQVAGAAREQRGDGRARVARVVGRDHGHGHG